MQRNDSIDILKGFGIILMIIAHTCGPNNILWDFIYTFHMPLFFLVSGYFHKQEPIALLLKKNIRRLLIPYFVLCVIIVCLSQLRMKHSIMTDINDALNGIGPGWFLLALFFSKIFFNSIVRYFHNHYLIVSTIISLSTSFIVTKFGITTYFSIYPAFASLFFLSVGYYAQKKDILNDKTKFKILVILGLIFWSTTLKFGKVILSLCIFKLSIIDFCGSVGGTIFIYLISLWINNNTNYVRKTLSYFGKYSLVILFYHSIDYCIYIWYLVEPYINNHLILISFITIVRLFIMYICVSLSIRSKYCLLLFCIKNVR